MSRVAAIQMASGPNIGANLIEAERLIGLAAESGADLVVLPENFAIMGLDEGDKVKCREDDGKGPIQEFVSRQAAAHGVWIVGGTVPLSSHDPSKIYAACMLYDSSGKRVARYDKMHLFDVHIEASMESYTESLTILPGNEVVVAETPFGRIGLAVCYDLRFPELFRYMLDQGAEIFAVPSAFTAHTGKAHWESLVRVRAIENLCYIVAPAQGGYHINGRETFGDSMIVDPWGVVLDRLPSGAGVVIADIDLERLRGIRQGFPAISHRRLQIAPVPTGDR
ncbi:MAG TPA: carbon-nitrogen hydrolase family protein [Gammaproteobacteria bacterium]|nr:carbon-nitrogen hydrolase family protein [Gammaproteobacteria bacterium]